METIDTKGLAERIRERLKALNLSARAASLKVSPNNPDLIRGIFRGANKSIRGDNLTKLARVLGVSESWLMTGFEADINTKEEIKGIRYGGIVEAGAFRHNDGTDQSAPFRIVPLAPDPRYPATAQFAFEVIGDSMNRAHVEPGMWVQAVDVHAWERLHGQPGDGLLVIVARNRNGDCERELTVKRLKIFRDHIELRPESSNPAHKPIVFPNPPVEGDEFAGVIAVVLSSTWLHT